MKIGILTFHRSINNGAVMQCYALSKRLQKELPNDIIEVIDYHMPIVDEKYYDTSYSHYFKGSLKHKIWLLVRLSKTLSEIRQLKKRRISFESSLQNLPLSQVKIYSNSSSELIDYINKTYDIVVAGSDAIWNYNLRGFPNPYFLSKEIKCPKLSYAASCHGMSYEKNPDFQSSEIKKILDTYEFLGTRDEESNKFLKHIGCSIIPSHTCDPTLLLDLSTLPIDILSLEQKLRTRGYDFKKKTIGIMGDEKMCKMIRRMFGNEYQLVSLYNYNTLCDINLNDITPYEWAYVFRYFDVTITTYFHGTLLSLRNGVPVVSIALELEYAKNHITKVEDVLNRLGLIEFYWTTDYKKTNLDDLKDYIVELINDKSLKKTILSNIETEAKSFDLFMKKINDLKNRIEQ